MAYNKVRKDPYENGTGYNTRISMKERVENYDEKQHYYGKIRRVSSIDDVSYLRRGSVYFLRDNPNDPNSAYHPYIIMQSMLLDKIGKIAVFGITSTPSSINMIPIIMKGAIGYIDPHQPYIYKINTFFEKGTRYIGTIVNQTTMDLLSDIYGMYLGMNLNRTEEEIIDSYNKYINEFKERSKTLKPYKHKVLEDSDLQNIELKVSFDINPIIEDEIMMSNFEIDVLSEVQPEETNIKHTRVYTHGRPKLDKKVIQKAIALYNTNKYSVAKIIELTGVPKTSLYRALKESNNNYENEENTNEPDYNTNSTIDNCSINSNENDLIIDINNSAVQAMLDIMKTKGQPKLHYHAIRMTKDEVIIFLAFIKTYGERATAKKYNTTITAVQSRVKVLSKIYNIIYIE